MPCYMTATVCAMWNSLAIISVGPKQGIVLKNKPVTFGKQSIAPGEQKTVEIPLAAMVTHNDLQMTVHVVNGKSAGPCLFISAAVHGDELNGVEIIRRLMKQKQLQRLRGTLVMIPIVNVHGFINHSRYLPDGRDLNRSFPGSPKGSLAARIADTFLREIVSKCTHGIDLHTGARQRENLPQIRADLSHDETRQSAMAFGVPVVVDSKIRDGSLRQAAGDMQVPMLLYEAGEALRFDEICIRAGVRGALLVMREIGMLPMLRRKETARAPVITANTGWVRAPNSGILRALVPLGARASKGSVLGVIADPLGQTEYQVMAPNDGIVIGRTNMPLIHEGDALYHLAYYRQKVDKVKEQLDNFIEQHVPEPVIDAPQTLDDDPIS